MKQSIIAFEGIDGSGKGVQLKLMENLLISKGYKTGIMDFPAYDSFFGMEIGKFLSGKYEVSADTVDARSMSLWYAMDRWQAFRNTDNSDKDVVLLNRSTLSNTVYQTLRCNPCEAKEMISWIRELEFGTLGIPEPDLYIIFDVSVKSSRKNVALKGHRDYVGEDSDVYEKNTDFLERVRLGYIDASAQFKNACLINCLDDSGNMRTREDILAEAFDKVKKFL